MPRPSIRTLDVLTCCSQVYRERLPIEIAHVEQLGLEALQKAQKEGQLALREARQRAAVRAFCDCYMTVTRPLHGRYMTAGAPRGEATRSGP